MFSRNPHTNLVRVSEDLLVFSYLGYVAKRCFAPFSNLIDYFAEYFLPALYKHSVCDLQATSAIPW